MQPDSHEALYRGLLDVTTRVELALVSGEGPGELEGLAAEHGKVLACLKQAGQSRDPELLDLARETNGRVRRVIEELKRRRDETQTHIAAAANRERLARAYKR